MDSSLANWAYAFLILIAVFAIPSIWRLAKAPWRVKTIVEPEIYEDEDGIATEESMGQFSQKIPFIFILGSTTIGLAESFALAVFATVRNELFSELCLTETWLLFVAWVFMTLQIFDTWRGETKLIKFYRAAYNTASSALIVALAWIVILGEFPPYPDRAVLVALIGTQMLFAIVLTFALVSIPRRPDVFKDGRLVERQFQVSLFTRYNFDWASEVLDLAATKPIEVTEMPVPDHRLRSDSAKARFRSIALKDTLRLWKLIFWAFQMDLYWQWTLITISCFFDVAPQYAMLKILRYLENRQDFDPFNPEAWFWVAAMFVITAGSTIIDYRIMWLMFSDIAIPLRSILTALIFEKMMKIKDIKEVSDDSKKDKGDSKDPKDTKDDASKPKEESKQLKSQQDIINMFAVDTNLIGVFAANQQFYLNFGVRVILAIVFLWLLVGWQCMIAGMSAMAIMYPINHWLGKRYAGYQKALMKARDNKTKIITEALGGIRQIKFSAIEKQWTEKIDEIRAEELEKIWKTKVNNVIMGLASDLSPVLFAAFALATYAYIYGDLLPSIAFTALSLFMQLEGLMHMIPMLLTMSVNASVSADRIDAFLQAPERIESTHPGDSISFNKVSVAFPSLSAKEDEDRFILRDISLDFPNGALSVISGPTGSGKSLLLGAILGEAEVLSGDIRVPRPPPILERFDSKATAANWILPTSIAYVGQTPWIENATIKNNILFGLPDDPARYEKVIRACALTKDLAMFEDGDSTEVGAQGISLSGGQKWRLTLARAFYSRAGILILDDVFSALDAHVGKEIYDNALMGNLSEGRTRILVTHHVSLVLPRAKYAVRLGPRGTLEQAGLTEHLRETGDLVDIIKAEDTDENSTTEVASEAASDEPAKDPTANGAPAKAPPKKLVEDEGRATGAVKTGVYLNYLKASGGFSFWTLVVVVCLSSQALTIMRSWWVKIWTASYEHAMPEMIHITHKYSIQNQFFTPNQNQYFTPTANSTVPPNQGNNEALRNLEYYLGIYVAISLVSILVAAGRVFLIYRGSLVASRKVFTDMTYSVLRTPLRWLDTVPTGRILNRFTADFQNLDSQLSMNFAYITAAFLEMIGILVAAFFITPYMIALSLFLLAICIQITRRYLIGARSIKRLESIQKSPMISHFSSSLEGLSTIRAFNNVAVFETRMYRLIDSFATATWHNWLFNNWMGYRLALVGSIFSSAVAAFVVCTKGIDASLAGFALAFAMDYRGAAIRTVRMMAQTELDMNAAERIFEYTELPIEKQDGSDTLRASWPEEGKLEIKDLEVGYAEDLPSILKGLTFKVESNQRIGVVGRTGAGKSTLSLALFRFLEARKGTITIDGLDISTIKLHDLRTRLAIIPQDPVLFSGTIRSNLDPFDDFSDHQIKEALQRVHLIPSVSSTPALQPEPEASTSTSSAPTLTDVKSNANIFLDLSSPVSSSGSNLSQGQKQLLCLARAILSRPRLLLLDEATSAVDMVTDALIQRSIREEFANTTLLVVAHRLSTVADFDRILVMRDGVAAEFGSPKELLQKEDGVFKSMVGQSGEKEELEKSILGSDS